MTQHLPTPILCEACGYLLESEPPPSVGTSAGAPSPNPGSTPATCPEISPPDSPLERCPECGRLYADSDPAYRHGTPWQAGASVRSWAQTLVAILRRPGQTFARMRIDPHSWRLLVLINVLLSAALIDLPWVGVTLEDPARGAGQYGLVLGGMLYVASFAVQTVLIAMALLCLTRVEHAGIRFFAARRGWRLTHHAAWQVCAHASFGWLACGLTPLFAMAGHFTFVNYLSDIAGRAFGPEIVRQLPPLRVLFGAGVLGLAYVLGLLAFEVLVYIGVRRCMYANEARSEVARPEIAPTG